MTDIHFCCLVSYKITNVKDLMGLIYSKLCHPFIAPCKCATFLNKSYEFTKASGNTEVQEDDGLYSSQLS